MKTTHTMKILSIATVIAGGYLADDAGAQQQIRRIMPSAPVGAAPANAIARPVVPSAPIPPAPPPIAGGKSGANGKMAAPGSPSHGVAPNRTFVPTPTGLTNTLDSKVCTQHAGISGGLGCSAGLPSGMLALVWDCAGCKVDGYRLFRVDGTLRDAVAIPANGADFTAALLNAPPGGFGNRCYAVLAYRGANESELSQPYCTGTGSVMTMTTDTFVPDHVRSSSTRKYNQLFASPKIENTSTGNLVVGDNHFARKIPAGDDWSNRISRGALHFTVDKLSKKHIFSAKLRIIVDTTSEAEAVFDHSTSCAAAIDPGKDYWWNHGDWIQTKDQHSMLDTAARLQPGPVDGPNASYDVTPIVADWAQGGENFGLVLMTDDQGIDVFFNGGCQTTYTGTITLEVKYWG